LVLVASALVVAPAARATPDEDFYAYAGGAATSPSSCPQADVAGAECTLAQALAIAPAGANVLLATGGSDGTYYGISPSRRQAPHPVRP
jgi:hypothetical protein